MEEEEGNNEGTDPEDTPTEIPEEETLVAAEAEEDLPGIAFFEEAE